MEPDVYCEEDAVPSECLELRGFGEEKGIEIGDNSFMNRVFLFVLEVLNCRVWQGWFFFIQSIIPCVQLFIIGFWPMFWSIWETCPVANVVRGVYSVVRLTYNGSADVVSLIIICVFYGFVIIPLVLFFVYFASTGGISRPMALCSNVILHILVYWGIIPSYHILGAVIGNASATVEGILSFIAIVIVCAIATLLFVFVSLTMSYLASPTKSIMASFDAYYCLYVIILACIKEFLASLSVFFGTWYPGLLFCLSLLATIGLIIKVRRYPYVGMVSNVFYAGFLVMLIASDLQMLVEYYTHLLTPKWILVVIPLCGYVIGLIAFGVYFRKLRKQVAAVLLPSGEPEPEDSKVEINSVSEAKMYFSMGFDLLAPCVLNGDFTFAVSEKFDEFDLWYITTSILAFIPGDDELFLLALSRLRMKCTRQAIQRMLVKRLIRIAEQRFFEASDQFSIRLKEMEKETHGAITMIKNFWEFLSSTKRTDVDFTIMQTVASTVNRSKAKWKELVLMYPNVTRFLDAYAQFKIECTGNISKGIELKRRADGDFLKNSIDPLLRQFCIANPGVVRYLEENCPQFRKDDDMGSSSSQSESESDDDRDDDLLNNLEEIVQAGHLRMPVYKATSGYQPKHYRTATVLGSAGYAIIILLIIGSIIVVRSLFLDFLRVYRTTHHLIALRVCYAFSTEALLLLHADQNGHGLTVSTYDKYIPATAKDEAMTIVPGQLTESGDLWVSSTLDSFSAVLEIFGRSATDDQELMNFFVNELRNFECCFRNADGVLEKSHETMGLVDAMSMGIWLCKECMTEYLDHLLNSEHYCMWSGIIVELPDLIAQMTTLFEENSIEILRSLQWTSRLFLGVIVAVIVIGIPFTILPQILLEREVKKVFAAMKTVTSDAGADKSSGESGAESQTPKVSQFINLSTNVKVTLIGLRFIYSLIFAACIAMSVGGLISVSNISAMIAQLVRISIYGGTRHPVCAEILVLCTQTVLRRHLSSDSIPRPDNDELERRTKIVIELNNMYLNTEYGMGTVNKNIRDLQHNSKCDVGESAKYEHDRYVCMGLDNALSTFILYCENFVNSTDPELDSRDFANILHLMCAELNEMLEYGRGEDLRFITEQVESGREQIAIIMSLTVVLLVSNGIIDIALSVILKRLLKISMILIRHIPPASIAQNPELVSLFLPKRDYLHANGSCPDEVIFQMCNTSIVVIGVGTIIDFVNHTFQERFHLATDMLIGHPLTTIIPKPEKADNDAPLEEQGAFHLYEKLDQMLEFDATTDQCSYVTKCLCGEEYITVEVTAYKVMNRRGAVSSIVVFLEDQRSLESVQTKLEEVQQINEQLIGQIVPRDIANFAANRGAFSFVIKTATLLAVNVSSVLDVIRDDLARFDVVLSSIEGIIRKNPPFVVIKTVYNTVYAIGGLFHDGSDPGEIARHGIKLARDISRHLSAELPTGRKKRFAVGMAIGGPFLSGLVGDRNPVFEVSGALIDVVSELTFTAPDEGIIVSKDFKDALGDTEVRCKSGPEVAGSPTFLF